MLSIICCMKNSVKNLKEYNQMKTKNGFLLVELMMGLVVSIFFILIITHYIIEVHSTQQKALKKIENFSTKRNKTEKKLSQKIIPKNLLIWGPQSACNRDWGYNRELYAS